MSRLFSKSALDGVATPEQLDQQTKIVKPFYWLAITAFGILIVGIIVWGIFGNINSTVELQGIIFPKAGVVQISCQKTGTVQDVLYSIGDEVKKGDILAVIPDEAVYEKIERKKDEIKNTGSVRKKKVLEQELESLYVEYEQSSVIRSTEDGTIQNIVNTGELLEAGEQTADILVNSQYTNNRQVAAYVPLKVAKRLEVGMEVQICPSHVSREEYGYMEGYITSIGKVPVTEKSLKSYYGNLEYVTDVLPDESCVEILIGIQGDEDSENLFRWSNPKGKSVTVEVGTVCDIKTVIENKTPISLLY